MKLNQNQLDILRAIENGQWSDTEIAQELGLHISTVRYLLNVMKDQDLFDSHLTYNDEDSRKTKYIIHKLTDKGKVAINNPDDLIIEEDFMTNKITFTGPINAPIGVLQNSDGNTVNITQNNNQNIQEIINSLEFLEKEVQVFPEEEKQEALIYLDSLKTEIKTSQNPAKIRTFFKGFLKIATPVLISLIVNGADFANNVTDLATKFDVDISHISLSFK
jgi:predicted transcriptional regulator